jgi:hypothetical protein
MATAKKRAMSPAVSLQDAANSENSLQGYSAINTNPADHAEIAEIAYRYYLERGEGTGSAEQDWFRAEEELRRRRDGNGSSR